MTDVAFQKILVGVEFTDGARALATGSRLALEQARAARERT